MAQKQNIFHPDGWSPPTQPHNDYVSSAMSVAEYIAELIARVWGLPGEMPSSSIAAIDYEGRFTSDLRPSKVEPPMPSALSDFDALHSAIKLLGQVVEDSREDSVEVWIRHRVYGEALIHIADRLGVTQRWARYRVKDIDEVVAGHMPPFFLAKAIERSQS